MALLARARRPERPLPVAAGLVGLLGLAVFALGLETVPVAVILPVVGLGLVAGIAAGWTSDARLAGASILSGVFLTTVVTIAGAFSIGFLFAPAAMLWLVSGLPLLWRRREAGTASAALAGVGLGLLLPAGLLIAVFAVGVVVSFLPPFD